MRYFLQIHGRTEGPFTVEEVENLHGIGKVHRATPCRHEGKDAEWSSIYNLVPTAIWVSSPQNQPVRLSNDPPQRRGPSKNVLWIGLSCLVALALLIPFLLVAFDELGFEQTYWQIPAVTVMVNPELVGTSKNEPYS